MLEDLSGKRVPVGGGGKRIIRGEAQNSNENEQGLWGSPVLRGSYDLPLHG
jgi:hypothetical protein